MIYILHGDDITASRKRLADFLEERALVFLDGKTVVKSELEEKLMASGLFEDGKVIVIENITKNPKKKELILMIGSLKSSYTIILWEDKRALKTAFSAIKGAKMEEFMLPTYYFKFLDTLSPGNKKEAFTLYHMLLKTYAPEQLLFSLLKRVRQLVVLSSGSKTDDILKMSSWQISNLNRQLHMWKRESLFSFYENLKQTEIKLKTGALPVSLAKHLDILILSQLT